jgi:Helicase associated domain
MSSPSSPPRPAPGIKVKQELLQALMASAPTIVDRWLLYNNNNNNNASAAADRRHDHTNRTTRSNRDDDDDDDDTENAAAALATATASLLPDTVPSVSSQQGTKNHQESEDPGPPSGAALLLQEQQQKAGTKRQKLQEEDETNRLVCDAVLSKKKKKPRYHLLASTTSGTPPSRTDTDEGFDHEDDKDHGKNDHASSHYGAAEDAKELALPSEADEPATTILGSHQEHEEEDSATADEAAAAGGGAHKESSRSTTATTLLSSSSRKGANWNYWLERLKGYKEKTGSCHPHRHMEDGYRLGIWVSQQRNAGNKGELSAEQKGALMDLGLFAEWKKEGAVVEKDQQRWDVWIARLKRFKERTGTCHIPHRHLEDGYKLAYWVRKQRDAEEQGKLSSERKQQLGDIGIEWKEGK